MTSQAMAQAYVRAARAILGEAEGHHTRGIWHLTVRRCQESVEMALKPGPGGVRLQAPEGRARDGVLGDDEVGLPAERLYTAGGAEQALTDARWVLALADAAVPPPA